MASLIASRRIPRLVIRLGKGTRNAEQHFKRSFVNRSAVILSSTTPKSNTYLCAGSINPSIAQRTVARIFSTHGDKQHVELRENLTIDAHDLIKAVEDDEVYVVDVRTPEECSEGRIMSKRWVNVPVQEFEEALKLSDEEFETKYNAPKPQKDAEDIVFHCRGGVRSTKALYAALEQGYKKARHYPEGWIGWEAHTYPLKDN